MDAWLVAAWALVLLLLMAALYFSTRQRDAESTLAAIRAAISSEAEGVELVSEIRSTHEQQATSASLVSTYRDVIEGASTGMAIVNGSGDIQFANPVAEGLLVGGEGGPVLKDSVAALVRRVRETGEAEQIESDVHDPVRRVLTTTAMSLADTGSVAIYIEDLSDRRRVDAMRTDFVANASHELKTPLGALSILAETLAETEDEVARTRLSGRLREEAVRMAHVIDDVVRLAETESIGLEFETIEMATLVDEAAESVATLASARGIVLVRGEVVDGEIEAAPSQVVSAIRNLLENAITYTAVKEKAGSVTYWVERHDGSICVSVEDTGVGVPDRYIDRVFERFFRVDRARSRESGGTGLGLSIVKNVAQVHGGSVRLASEVGVGSTFTFCIPEATGETL